MSVLHSARPRRHLYVPLWVEAVVPQDDLVVFAPSGQQGPVPHLTQSEHTAIMGLDLTTDLVRTYREWGGGQNDRQTERGGEVKLPRRKEEGEE